MPEHVDAVASKLPSECTVATGGDTVVCAIETDLAPLHAVPLFSSDVQVGEALDLDFALEQGEVEIAAEARPVAVDRDRLFDRGLGMFSLPAVAFGEPAADQVYLALDSGEVRLRLGCVCKSSSTCAETCSSAVTSRKWTGAGRR